MVKQVVPLSPETCNLEARFVLLNRLKSIGCYVARTGTKFYFYDLNTVVRETVDNEFRCYTSASAVGRFYLEKFRTSPGIWIDSDYIHTLESPSGNKEIIFFERC
jgi:hypothetical protein